MTGRLRVILAEGMHTICWIIVREVFDFLKINYMANIVTNS